jgi:hypothetical protein
MRKEIVLMQDLFHMQRGLGQPQKAMVLIPKDTILLLKDTALMQKVLLLEQ